MKRCKCLGFGLFASIGCFSIIVNAQGSPKKVLFSNFKNQQKIGNFSNVFKFDNGRVRSLFIADTSLDVWNGDGVDNYFFSQYSLKSNQLIRNMLQSGRQNGQGFQILSAGMLGDHTIWYYDIGLKKAGLLELAHTKRGKDSIVISEFPLPGKIYYSSQLINRSTMLGSGVVDTGHAKVSSVLQQIDIVTMKQTGEFGIMEEAPANTPFNSWRSANQGFLFLNSSRTKAVLAKHYTDEIEIFDLKTNKSLIVKGPDNLNLEFNSFSGSKMDISGPNDKTVVAFVSGATTDKYIYLLYMGIPTTKNKGYKVNASQSIFVYDWNGNPVMKLNLDREIMGFTISKNNELLYAYDPSTKYVVKANFEIKK